MSKQLRLRLVKPRSSTQAHRQRIDHISATRAYAIAIKEIAAYARVYWATALFHSESSQNQPSYARQAPRSAPFKVTAALPSKRRARTAEVRNAPARLHANDAVPARPGPAPRRGRPGALEPWPAQWRPACRNADVAPPRGWFA